MHPVGSKTSSVQVLAAKQGEWRLLLNAEGHIERHLNLLSGWVAVWLVGSLGGRPVGRPVIGPAGGVCPAARAAGGGRAS